MTLTGSIIIATIKDRFCLPLKLSDFWHGTSPRYHWQQNPRVYADLLKTSSTVSIFALWAVFGTFTIHNIFGLFTVCVRDIIQSLKVNMRKKSFPRVLLTRGFTCKSKIWQSGSDQISVECEVNGKTELGKTSFSVDDEKYICCVKNWKITINIKLKYTWLGSTRNLYDHWKEIIKHWLFFSLSMQRHLFHVIHVSAPCNTFISLFILSLRARILHNAVIEFARRIQHKVTNLKLFRNYFHSKWDTKSPYKGVTRHISVDRQLPRQRWWLIWDDGQRGCIE